MTTEQDQAAAPTVQELVLWSDESLLAVNKPPGLLTIPGGYQPEPHLRQILEPAFGRLWTVHRLDRETSGVLVFARTADAHRALNTRFQEHTTLKVYHALVMGQPEWAQCTVEVALKPDGDRRHRTIALPSDRADEGKPALTACRVLERYELPDTGQRCALIEAIPKTGRTHQIRAHLAYLGLPLVADKLYRIRGQSSADLTRREKSRGLSITRTALHALNLTIHHPVTHRSVCFEAPYAEDFAAALHHLRKHAAEEDE
jgi:RluA family pseudouridine synthase